MRNIIFVVILLFTHVLRAQNEDFISVTKSGEIEAKSAPEAVRELNQKLIGEVARELIVQLVGEKKYQKSRAIIESKIIREHAKFIPLINSGEPIQEGSLYRMTVDMKVSVESLRKLLMNAGVFYESEGPSAVMSFVSIQDRVHEQAFHWWLDTASEDSKGLVYLDHNLQKALEQEFGKQGFFFFSGSPLVARLIPPSFRTDHLASGDLKTLSQIFRSSIVLQGFVRLRPSPQFSGGTRVLVRIEAIQGQNQRTVGEISRVQDFDSSVKEGQLRAKLTALFPDVAKDLGVQILDAYQKGTLGASLLKIAVRGNLNPKQLNDIRAAIQKSVPEIKALRERMFEPGQVDFEADFSGNISGVREKLKTIEVPGFKVGLHSSGTEKADASDAFVLDVSPQ